VRFFLPLATAPLEDRSLKKGARGYILNWVTRFKIHVINLCIHVTHCPLLAYRLIAKNTVEEKIRALQREKSELAAAVVQEESLATVMDLDSLRRILG